MCDDLEKRALLLYAAEHGEILLATYQGGTQPGTLRELGPLTLVGDQCVRAWCLMTSRIKQYRIEALHFHSEQDRAQFPPYRPDVPDDAPPMV